MSLLYWISFFRRFYRPDNVVLLVVGDVDPATVLPLVRRYYGEWEAGYEPPDVRPEPEQTGERRGEVAYPGKTLPILQLSYKGDRFDPEDAEYVAAVLLGDLAFGETSPIYRSLVLDRQTVQMLGAQTPMNRDQPLFEIMAMVKQAANVGAVLDDIDRTLAELRQAPPDNQRLAQLKRRHRYGFLMDLDTPDGVAGQLARPVAITGGIECVDRFYAAIERVTPEELTRAARKYFDPQRRTVMVLKGAQE